MTKVQNFSAISQNIPFTEFDFYDVFRMTFGNTELGRMKRMLPLHEMAVDMDLVDRSIRRKRGRKSYFTPEGKVALMFLKMYTQMSFPELMEHLNGNVYYQIFCDIVINPNHPLTSYKLLDDIASEIAGKLKIQSLQNLLAQAWRPYMKDLDTMFTDGTCYESEVRYPTDVKLLWECIQKSYEIMCGMSKQLGRHRMRTKHLEVSDAIMGYMKQRRRKSTKTRRILRRELALLDKILKEVRELERESPEVKTLSIRQKNTIGVITKVFRQQKNHFNSADARESVPITPSTKGHG